MAAEFACPLSARDKFDILSFVTEVPPGDEPAKLSSARGLVRLKVISGVSGAESTDPGTQDLLSRVKAAAEAFERELKNSPDEKPIWLEEVGLRPSAVDLLLEQGVELHFLRSTARHLRARGLARCESNFRRVIEGVRGQGFSDAIGFLNSCAADLVPEP